MQSFRKPFTLSSDLVANEQRIRIQEDHEKIKRAVRGSGSKEEADCDFQAEQVGY